ncbi:MAG TPA: glutamate--cysteine ligase, partial [Candidatus Paceibacterota bacterium]|nr:glutamate--cysteine ligase [Candidatus Paceibacterota bacterium]
RALQTPWRRGTLRDVALGALEIARAGLVRRSRLDANGDDESHFLDTLFTTVASGKTVAQEMLYRFETEWGGNIDSVVQAYEY